MYLDFCFCFSAWYFYKNYKFSNRIKICAITAGIKKYKSIIKKKKKKHDTTALLAKSKLNSIEALLSKALVYSVISNDEFKDLINFIKDFSLFKKQCCFGHRA